MEHHHSEAIDTFMAQYRHREEFLAILLAGSLAHGYAKPNSDVDIILIAAEDEYRSRQKEKRLAFSLRDICSYPGGYVDCKVVSLGTLNLIAEKGSDAARYAFKDAQVLVSRIPSIESILQKVTRFPAEAKSKREYRFVCQFLAWKWYLSQAEEKRDMYLMHLAIQKLVLFACRIVLNRNERLYPYHKWLLAEVRTAGKAPGDFAALLESLIINPSYETAQTISDRLLSFAGLKEQEIDWPNQFMFDSEMNWIDHEPPVDDI